MWNRAGEDGVKVSQAQSRQGGGRKSSSLSREVFDMEMCLLKTMGRGGALLVQGLRKMSPPKQTPYTSLKQTVRMKEFTVVLLTTSSKERGGDRALALHQALRKRY